MIEADKEGAKGMSTGRFCGKVARGEEGAENFSHKERKGRKGGKEEGGRMAEGEAE